MNINDILRDLDNFLQGLIDSEPKTQQKVNKSTLSNDKKALLEERFGGWQSPIKGVFYNSGEYGIGDERHKGRHDGVDLRAPGGTSTYPISEGFVEKVDSWDKGGNIITILHAKNVRTYYAHMGTVTVQPGQYVDKNTVIGTIGNSGNAINTAPHIHLEVRQNGKLINPGTLFDIPKFTKFNKEKEKIWLSQDAKQIAKNFNMKEHQSKLAFVSDKFFKKYYNKQ